VCLFLLLATAHRHGVAAEDEEDSHYLYDGADAEPVQEYHGVYVWTVAAAASWKAASGGRAMPLLGEDFLYWVLDFHTCFLVN
jgi:hypothetical protein